MQSIESLTTPSPTMLVRRSGEIVKISGIVSMEPSRLNECCGNGYRIMQIFNNVLPEHDLYFLVVNNNMGNNALSLAIVRIQTNGLIVSNQPLSNGTLLNLIYSQSFGMRIPMLNGYGSRHEQYRYPSVSIQDDGLVFLSGVVTNLRDSPKQLFSVLPMGYRPQYNLTFVTANVNDGLPDQTVTRYTRVDVFSNGCVYGTGLTLSNNANANANTSTNLSINDISGDYYQRHRRQQTCNGERVGSFSLDGIIFKAPLSLESLPFFGESLNYLLTLKNLNYTNYGGGYAPFSIYRHNCRNLTLLTGLLRRSKTSSALALNCEDGSGLNRGESRIKINDTMEILTVLEERVRPSIPVIALGLVNGLYLAQVEINVSGVVTISYPRLDQIKMVSISIAY